MKTSFSRKLFVIFNTVILSLLILVTLYPIWHVICASFSNYDELIAHRGILLKPYGFTTVAYRLLFRNRMIYSGLKNTAAVIFFGLILNMVMTTIGAYFLTRKNVFWRDFIMMAIVFTMYFSGGIIPFYFTVKELHMDNTLLSLIIPAAVSTYNLIILRTAFAAVPESLEESARLDGAGHLSIIKNVYVPLALPSLAVILLYYFVSHWNSWFSASIFLRDRSMFPLQLIMREILIQNSTEDMLIGTASDQTNQVSELIKYALIVASLIPVMCIYPFIQRFFVKGVMIGAVKG